MQMDSQGLQSQCMSELAINLPSPLKHWCRVKGTVFFHLRNYENIQIFSLDGLKTFILRAWRKEALLLQFLQVLDESRCKSFWRSSPSTQNSKNSHRLILRKMSIQTKIRKLQIKKHQRKMEETIDNRISCSDFRS